MKLIRIKLNFLIQCWQLEDMTIKTFCTCINLPFKTTNSRNIDASDIVLVPLLQCSEYSNTAEFTGKIMMRICNLQLQ